MYTWRELGLEEKGRIRGEKGHGRRGGHGSRERDGFLEEDISKNRMEVCLAKHVAVSVV